MKITFIQTGGTIDKDYPKETEGYGFEIGKPAVERILQKVNPNIEFKVISLMRKDSLDLNDEDIDMLFNECMRTRDDKIIITHGTDTIVKTADRLHSISKKVIILTGSLRPEKFADSDAPFNIGVAIGAINVLREGVYVAMNGRIYSWDNVMRNPETGQFIESEKTTG